MASLVFVLAAAVAFLLILLAGPGAAVPAPGPGIVFRVGGPRGWRVPDDNTSYDWWAKNNRFHVGDALYFRYKNDSVLVVDRDDLDSCNATEPLARFADGRTTVRLDRPGFFCFISGEPGHCEEDQRLIVRVMVHPAEAAPSPAVSPATAQLGHDAGGSGSGNRPGTGTSSGATAVDGAAAGALAVLVCLAMLVQ